MKKKKTVGRATPCAPSPEATPPHLTLDEVFDELRLQTNAFMERYRHADGKVHDPAALRTIDALSQAMAIIFCQLHPEPA